MGMGISKLTKMLNTRQAQNEQSTNICKKLFTEYKKKHNWYLAESKI